jgi:DNA-binding response OmpR family regulator
VKTVLLVDADLGFIFWLGKALDRAGYDALPARSVADARVLLHELNPTIDLVILNPALADAASFVEKLRQSDIHLKFIALLDHPADEVKDLPGIDAVQCKPETIDELTGPEWLQFIQGVLSGNTVAL